MALFAVTAPAVRAAQGDCSQPVSSGDSPLASDCLFLLRAAVGSETCSPRPCVCDPNGDGNRTATDALTCLKRAVGESIALVCPCASGTTTTTQLVTTTTVVGATTTTIPNTADCTNDGKCSAKEDCVCPDCDDDLFCSNPDNCKNNGVCEQFEEGCVCEDCKTHPECLDNQRP